MGLLLGYARVSTTDQGGQAQFNALREAGVPEEQIYFDQLSGAKAARERSGLSALLADARRDAEARHRAPLARGRHRPLRADGQAR